MIYVCGDDNEKLSPVKFLRHNSFAAVMDSVVIRICLSALSLFTVRLEIFIRTDALW